MRTSIPKQLLILGKSRRWLAEQVGLHPNTIDYYICGDSEPTSLAIMRKIADALNCNVRDLFPHIHEDIDWEHRYNVITDHLNTLHYKSKEFTELCHERSAASVHAYIATHNKQIRTYMNTYSIKEYSTEDYD